MIQDNTIWQGPLQAMKIDGEKKQKKCGEPGYIYQPVHMMKQFRALEI